MGWIREPPEKTFYYAKKNTGKAKNNIRIRIGQQKKGVTFCLCSPERRPRIFLGRGHKRFPFKFLCQ